VLFAPTACYISMLYGHILLAKAKAESETGRATEVAIGIYQYWISGACAATNTTALSLGVPISGPLFYYWPAAAGYSTLWAGFLLSQWWRSVMKSNFE